jgi:cold shock CspA family protein
VQATVRQWDPASGAGDVLLDDGRLVSFSGDAFSVSGLRLLRLGQRVRMQFDGAGNVAWVTIATLPDPVD